MKFKTNIKDVLLSESFAGNVLQLLSLKKLCVSVVDFLIVLGLIFTAKAQSIECKELKSTKNIKDVLLSESFTGNVLQLLSLKKLCVSVVKFLMIICFIFNAKAQSIECKELKFTKNIEDVLLSESFAGNVLQLLSLKKLCVSVVYFK